MRRAVITVWVCLALLTLSFPSVVRAQTDDDKDLEATIEALQTQVSDLESQLTPAATTAEDDSDSATATPSDTASESFVVGNGIELIPEGEPNELSVVTIGTYDGNTLPIIVRNRTGDAVRQVEVTATAQSPDGSLLAVGGDQSFTPDLVEAGGITLGYVYFDGVDLPSDAEFAFDVTASGPELGSLGSLDLNVVDWNDVGGRIVGFLENPHDVVVMGPIEVVGACLDDTGGILAVVSDFTESDTVEPGQQIPFQLNLRDTPCSNIVLAANGYNF